MYFLHNRNNNSLLAYNERREGWECEEPGSLDEIVSRKLPVPVINCQLEKNKYEPFVFFSVIICFYGRIRKIENELNIPSYAG